MSKDDSTLEFFQILKKSASQTINTAICNESPTQSPISYSKIFSKTSKTSKSQKPRLLSLAFIKAFRRISVWIAIISMINYRYWTGRIQFPLSCNLFGLRCPSWPVEGTVSDGYESVVDAFKKNFQDGHEIGSSFVAYIGHQPVVELYGGYHNQNYKRPYDHNSLQLVFSSSKFIESMVITYLVDKGHLNFEDKITKHWPEFAQGNKENVTVSSLLGHRAGVTYLDRPPTLTEIADLDQLAILLAAQPHNFNGTSVQAYHAVTRGWYLNEIVRRIDPQKRTLGQIMRQDIMPLLDVEFYLGLPRNLENRVSPLVGYPALRALAKILVPSKFQKDPMPKGFSTVLFDRKSVSYKATQGSNPKQIRMWPYTHNRREIWAAEGPSYGGITNARSLARFAALIANGGILDGVRLISEETVKISLQPLPWMKDHVFSRNVTFAQGGFGLGFKFPGSDLEWIGWGGVGGSMIFFNPKTKISFAYVMNSMTMAGIGDMRSFALVSEFIFLGIHSKDSFIIKTERFEKESFSGFSRITEDKTDKQNASSQCHEFYLKVSPTVKPNNKILLESNNNLKLLNLTASNENAEYLNYIKILPNACYHCQNYGGHQYGVWNGQLGDGRAIHLGQIKTQENELWSIRIKGIGRMPFSRHGDGLMTLKSCIREFLASEYLAVMGIPTVRTISISTTKEEIIRKITNANGISVFTQCGIGGMISQMAPSFIRFGTFELFYTLNDKSKVQKLADYVISTHYPELKLIEDKNSMEAKIYNVYALLFKKIVQNTAILMANWQSIGFVHGIMNTDQMSIHGISMHFGAFCFLEEYEPMFTPNLSDKTNRHRLENQSDLAKWNLTRLGNVFVDLIVPELFTSDMLTHLHSPPVVEPVYGINGPRMGKPDLLAVGEMIMRDILNSYEDTFMETFILLMQKKLGLLSTNESTENDFEIIILPLLTLMADSRVDYTQFMRSLSDFKTTSPEFEKQIAYDEDTFEAKKDDAKCLYLLLESCSSDTLRLQIINDWIVWANVYRERCKRNLDDEKRSIEMKKINPVFTMRNWILDSISKAVEDDLKSEKFSEARKRLENASKNIQMLWSDAQDMHEWNQRKGNSLVENCI